MILANSAIAATYELSKVAPDFLSSVHLFGHDIPYAESYSEYMRKLRSGDVIVFSNGHRETVVEVLGSETQSKIIRIENGHALRLPLKRTDLTSETSVDQFHFGMIHLHQLLPKLEVLTSYDYLPHEFVEVDRLTDFVLLSQFFRDLNARAASDPLKYLSKEDLKIARERLFEFARITAPLVMAGDQTANNIVYSRSRGWLFIDVNDQHILYSEVGWSRNLFTHLNTPPSILRSINRIVRAERQSISTANCQQALTPEDLMEIIKKRQY